MNVTLQVDNQFGNGYDTLGPDAGAKGTCWEVKKIDGDFWAYCTFEDWAGMYIVNLEHLMILRTDTNETYWSTR